MWLLLPPAPLADAEGAMAAEAVESVCRKACESGGVAGAGAAAIACALVVVASLSEVAASCCRSPAGEDSSSASCAA